jgi:heterodisulfide reductase subunit A-like polyferredoxin
MPFRGLPRTHFRRGETNVIPIANPIVIAGGSGFLGISLATHLASSGMPVLILSKPPGVSGPWRHVKRASLTTVFWVLLVIHSP